MTKADSPKNFTGKRVLFWEPGGLPPILIRDIIIATALRIRGAEVQFVICDGAPSACVLRELASGEPLDLWSKKCPSCFRACVNTLASFNLSYHSIGDFVPQKRRAELRALAQGVSPEGLTAFQYQEVEVGHLANSSLIRYFKGLPFKRQRNIDIAQEYLYGGLVCTEAATTAISGFRPDRLFMSHGCYIDYGTALTAATNVEIPVVVWGGSYLENHCYIHTITRAVKRTSRMLSEEGWQRRVEKPLTPEENGKLDKYLRERYTTDMAFDLRLSSQPTDPDNLRQKLGIPADRPVWCIFTHLNWEYILTMARMAYDTAESWILDTVQTIQSIPEVTWLIKIHPAEAYTNTKWGVQSLIRDNFPNLPAHIQLIPTDSDINTWGVYSLIHGGVVVFGTPGLEMAVLGKPAILAGEAHYAKRGFTHDGLTREDYRSLLRRAAQLPKLSVEQQALARQYAYSYFIQRQIPLTMLEKEAGGWGMLDYRKLDLLLPGKDKALDMVCERIINGGDFVMDEDMIEFDSTPE